MTAVGSEISTILHSFYTNLYSQAPSDEDIKREFWQEITLPQITVEQATGLTRPITAEEVQLAIKQLKPNKAPGPDGLTNEFYKTLGPKLIDTLVVVFNDLLDGKDLPLYFNSALLKVLPKPGRDPELPSSYRPILLLNSDYKLYTKILAERLKPILPQIIHEDQTGFISGRHSVTNVRKVLAVMQWLEQNDDPTPHAILSLDAEKAFDLIAWDHLFETLAKFGIPYKFISILRTLYSGSSTQILSNAYMSPPFPIRQGTRQGCPLSPLLFAMAIEPLAVALRASEMFRGIPVGEQEIKLSMFADDMLLFISDPVESLQNIITILDRFSAFAGFRVNYSKSNLLPLTADLSFFRGHPALTKFALCSSPLKYLGVLIPPKLQSLYQANIPPILKTITKSLQDWHQLPLSLSGRVAVIKSILFPKISYVFQLLPLIPSKKDVASLRSLFSNFIWQGKKPRVAFSKLTLTKEGGGYGLPDLQLFVHSIFFRQISDWFLERSSFSNPDLERILFALYSPSALLHSPRNAIPHCVLSNVLFRGTYNSWCAINKRLGRDFTSSEYNTLWGNPCFIPGMENPGFRRWRTAGIMAVKDVFDPGGVMYSFAQLKDIYGIPNTDFYMYLQARHYIQSTQVSKLLTADKDVFSETMSWIRLKPYKIRFLYPSLLEPLVGKLWENSLRNWSQDIPIINSSKTWLECCEYVLKQLPSAALQETHLKTLQRAYISPSRRKHWVLEESGECKKCAATDATFFHCFWECGKIKHFWNKLFNYINAIFSLHLVKSPVQCLLLNFADWDLGPLDCQIRPLLVIIFTVAKQCILSHWIEKSPPNLGELKARLLNIIYYERQKAFPDMEKGVIRFYRKWGIYIEHLPQDTKDQIQRIFESTSWYLKRQVV